MVKSGEDLLQNNVRLRTCDLGALQDYVLYEATGVLGHKDMSENVLTQKRCRVCLVAILHLLALGALFFRSSASAGLVCQGGSPPASFRLG